MEDIVARLGRIALIGGGKMGEAIIAGLVNGALFDPTTIVVAEPGEERREFLETTYGIETVEDGGQIKYPDTVILAVKPQTLRDVSGRLSGEVDFNPQRIVSIAAGVTTATLSELFPQAAIIRVMPNAPLMVGAGMSAVAVAEQTARAEGELICDLFSLMGEAVLLDESLLNAATAINGSGPAYFALFVRELTAAAIEVGLPPREAAQLALQTMVGTSRYLELTEQSPQQLMDAVTSPNGTTQAALESFMGNGFDTIVRQAVHAAVRRAEELA